METEEFIEAWNAAPSLECLWVELGIAPARASNRASQLRQRGVQMKYMTGHGKSISDEQFAEIWNDAESIEDVIRKTGLKRESARRKAGKIRSRGSIEMKALVRPVRVSEDTMRERQTRTDIRAGAMPPSLRTDVVRDWHTTTIGKCTVKSTDPDFLKTMMEKTNAIRSARLGRHGGVHTGNGATNVCAA